MEKKKMHGIITRGVGGLYGVRTEESPAEEILCRARGIFRQEQISPTVGDDVLIARSTEEDESSLSPEHIKMLKRERKAGVNVDFVIEEILDRRNLLIRPPVANLDYLYTVIPCASPEPDLLTADKLTVIAENYGIEPVIIINKADLSHDNAEKYADIYKTAGYDVFLVSCVTGAGIDDLRDYIYRTASKSEEGTHVTAAFAGVSGAGKSTLMSALFAGLSLQTGEISKKTERGRHTTRHVELYHVNCNGNTLWIADTPGFSMLDFTRFNFFPYDELALSFREFSDCIGTCKYTKCTHIREEGCRVLDKVKAGEISASRHNSYVKIFDEQRSVPEWKRR